MKKLPIFLIISLLFILLGNGTYSPAFASGNVAMSISGPSSVVSGQTFSVSILLDTQGSQTGTVQATFSGSGPVSFNQASASFASFCSFSGPVPGSTNTFYCGSSGNGFTASGDAFVTVSATATGSGTIDISVGNPRAAYNTTHYTVSTSGLTINSLGAGGSTPTPTPTQAPTATPTQSGGGSTSTPTPTSSKGKTTPTPAKAGATPLSVASPSSFNGKPTPKPTVTTANQPSLIVVSQPPYKTPTGQPGVVQQQETTTVTPTTSQNLQTLVQGYFNNAAAALLFILPILLLLGMVAFMSLRMYQMTRRRQREIELLFEHEIGELAALESKMDLINEKGDKGKKEFREEFERTKDQILKEIRPDYIGNTAETEKPPEA